MKKEVSTDITDYKEILDYQEKFIKIRECSVTEVEVGEYFLYYYADNLAANLYILFNKVDELHCFCLGVPNAYRGDRNIPYYTYFRPNSNSRVFIVEKKVKELILVI